VLNYSIIYVADRIVHAMAKLGGVANGQLFKVILQVEVDVFSLWRTEDREANLTWELDLNQTLTVAVFRQLDSVPDKRELNVETNRSGGSASFLNINAPETEVSCPKIFLRNLCDKAM